MHLHFEFYILHLSHIRTVHVNLLQYQVQYFKYLTLFKEYN